MDIYLEVFQYNEKGLEYYKRLGFKKYDESSLFNSLIYEVQKMTNAKETLTFEDGAVYEGEVVGGALNGKGRKTYPDGTFIEGIWDDDQFIG
jgi:hypothetical protein